MENQRPFNMADLFKSSDRIAYLNGYDKITIGQSDYLIENDKFLLNPDEFRIFASKCCNLLSYGHGLMEYACKHNDLDMIKCLMENGVDSHTCFYGCCTPSLITLASIHGDKALELVKFLIESDKYTWCHRGGTGFGLHAACKNGD